MLNINKETKVVKVLTHLSEFHLRTAIQSGAGVSKLLPDMMVGLNGKKAILFTDKGLRQTPIIDELLATFKNTAVRVVEVFDNIEQDAKAKNITEAVAFVKKHQADTLIAVGGGSVLDAVKGIKWMLAKGYDDMEQSLTTSLREFPPQAQPTGIPHIAIPTTAGTGAEVSPMAVIFNEKEQEKMVLRTPYLNADVALLDPYVTLGLPPMITAFTGMDALTHAIEGYFSTTATPFTDAYALYAAKLIIDNLPIVVNDGTNVEARSNMLLASTMAITAFGFGNNGVPVHNMAHVFGAKYRIPHGLANAVLLPNVMEALPTFYNEKIQNFAKNLGVATEHQTTAESLQAVITIIRTLRKEIGLPDTFAEYDLGEQVFDTIVADVQHDSASGKFLLPEEVILGVTKEVVGIAINKGVK